jgi:hypothetical protein
MDPILIGAITGAATSVIAVLLWSRFQPQRHCPRCGTHLSKFRKPENARQMMWGGWTCPSCGCEVDRKGRDVKV